MRGAILYAPDPTVHRGGAAGEPGAGRALGSIAQRKNATPAQVALAWLLAQKPWIVPIPGTRRLERLKENIGTVDVELTTDDLREIDEVAAKMTIKGARSQNT